MKLELQKEYKRTDLHEIFGGQRQGGISTPKDNKVILLFSGSSGEQYGYEDGWVNSDEYLYTGEGQVGDMDWIKGNKAIRDHQINDKDIFLFEISKKAHVIYLGNFEQIGFDWIKSKDKEGTPRNAIQFRLLRKSASAKLKENKTSKGDYQKPNTTERQGLVTSRVGQGGYRRALLKKYHNKCAVLNCGPAEILIASHILPWRESDDAQRLDPDNGILLSPSLDALFDRMLISFDKSGKIVLSSLVDSEFFKTLGVSGTETLSITPKMEPYLKWHRERLRH